MSQYPQVIYISYDGMTDPLGQSQVIPYLNGLSESFKIHLISCEKSEELKKGKDIIKNVLHSNITWYPLKYHRFPPVLSTVYDIFNIYNTTKKIVKENNVSIIHCRSYIAALIGLWFKRNHNIKFIFDMRGFWADERVEGNIWSLKKPLYKVIYHFFKKKESDFFKYADHIISLTEEGKKLIEEKYSATPITTIPCCVDTSLFIHDKNSQISKQSLNIPANDKVILYLGSIGTWYMLDEMLLFFKYYHQQFPESVFLIITKDNHDQIFKTAIKYELPDEKIILRSSDRKDVNSYISLADLGLFFIRPTFSKKASSPTKLAELLVMGIPVITNSGVGDVDSIIQNNNAGYLVEDLSESGLKKKVEEIKMYPKKFDAERLRNLAENEFSLQLGVSRYKDVYQSLI